jgi:hypothetical protein
MIEPAKYRIGGYEDFRERAQDNSLTLNEKCGFAEEFRAGYERQILCDISGKLTLLQKPGARICDIGAGCSELSHLIIETTGRNGQSLTVIDCLEMLHLLPPRPHLIKIEGPFPDCLRANGPAIGPFDAILAYSVAGFAFEEGNLFAFVDAAAALLADQGQLLLGDIANASMRKRFMASPAGAEYHKLYYAHLPQPEVVFDAPSPGEIDDGVILSLVARLRGAGFNAFVMPQAAGLPMANRREDILITKC